MVNPLTEGYEPWDERKWTCQRRGVGAGTTMRHGKGQGEGRPGANIAADLAGVARALLDGWDAVARELTVMAAGMHQGVPPAGADLQSLLSFVDAVGAVLDTAEDLLEAGDELEMSRTVSPVPRSVVRAPRAAALPTHARTSVTSWAASRRSIPVCAVVSANSRSSWTPPGDGCSHSPRQAAASSSCPAPTTGRRSRWTSRRTSPITSSAHTRQRTSASRSRRGSRRASSCSCMVSRPASVSCGNAWHFTTGPVITGFTVTGRSTAGWYSWGHRIHLLQRRQIDYSRIEYRIDAPAARIFETHFLRVAAPPASAVGHWADNWALREHLLERRIIVAFALILRLRLRQDVERARLGGGGGTVRFTRRACRQQRGYDAAAGAAAGRGSRLAGDVGDAAGSPRHAGTDICGRHAVAQAHRRLTGQAIWPGGTRPPAPTAGEPLEE